MAQSISELPRTVTHKALESGPRTVDIEATEAECAAIAERLSVDTVSSLTGSITLEKPSGPNPMFGGPLVIAQGTMRATLTQTCVVTLESFETTVESGFSGVFCNDDPADSMTEDEDEGMADLPDILGPLGEETIQIGEVFIEQLALEIDPFPRKPGAEFDGFSAGSAELIEPERESPFAVLAKLKDNLE